MTDTDHSGTDPRPPLEEFIRLTSEPGCSWGMADVDVVEICEYALRLESRLSAIRKETIEEKNEAYRQRAHLVAALARIFPSGIRRTDIPGWDAEWHGCCFIDLPSGQISYHYHDREAPLFADLPPYEKPWDGHSKETVHGRLVNIGADAERIARHNSCFRDLDALAGGRDG